MKIYPNPVDQQLNFEIGSVNNERIAWKMTSMAGMEILKGERKISSGTTIWSIRCEPNCQREFIC